MILTLPDLMWIKADHPFGYAGFGHPYGSNSYNNWVILDPEDKSADFPDSAGHISIWIPKRWISICFSYDHKSSFVMMVINGKTMTINGVDPKLKETQIPANFLTNFQLGYSQKCLGNGLKIADVQVWSFALTESQMAGWTKCLSSLKGDLVNWDIDEWEVNNMEWLQANETCSAYGPGLILFPEARDLINAGKICRRFRGEFPVISKVSNPELVAKLSNQSGTLCKALTDKAVEDVVRVWTGWNDLHTEGHFQHLDNPNAVLSMDEVEGWYPGEPNGLQLENCINIWKGGLFDMSCDNDLSCSYCNLDRHPELTLRGLCPGSKFDTKYYWTGNLSDLAGKTPRFTFQGISDSLIIWDSNSYSWTIHSDR